ncbi:MAG TPA: hypothetical protein VKR56_14375 [Candidatus Cybelea sp.]|nr:hypothetical protein [Candidatus Cybelea sp.]
MKLMHSDLYFHPDAGRQEGLRLGSLLFIKDEETQTDACVVGFYHAEGSPLMSAQRLTDDDFFSAIFKDFDGYVDYVASQTQSSRELSQEQVALNFIANLPQNLRATNPEPWPPMRVFTQAATERQPIHLFPIRHLQAA